MDQCGAGGFETYDARTGCDNGPASGKERLAAVVMASGTTTTKVFGVGQVIAAITIGLTRDVGRFADKDHFAVYNGSAPIEVSSGPKKIYRLSMRGSRQLNHALHMAAVTQVRHRHSEGLGLDLATKARQDAKLCPSIADVHRRPQYGQARHGLVEHCP